MQKANALDLPRRESLFRRFIHQWQIQVFALVGILYLILFSYVPMFGIIIAFKSYKLTSGIAGIFADNWVGLKYFKEFVTDYRFGELVRNTLAIRYPSATAWLSRTLTGMTSRPFSSRYFPQWTMGGNHRYPSGSSTFSESYEIHGIYDASNQFG